MSLLTSSKMLQKWLSDERELCCVREAKCPPPQQLTNFVDRFNSAQSHCYTASLGNKVRLFIIKKQLLSKVFLRLNLVFSVAYTATIIVFSYGIL